MLQYLQEMFVLSYPNYTEQYYDRNVRDLGQWKNYNPFAVLTHAVSSQVGISSVYTVFYNCKHKFMNDCNRYDLVLIDTCRDLYALLKADSDRSSAMDPGFIQIGTSSSRRREDLKRVNICVMHLIDLNNKKVSFRKGKDTLDSAKIDGVQNNNRILQAKQISKDALKPVSNILNIAHDLYDNGIKAFDSNYTKKQL